LQKKKKKKKVPSGPEQSQQLWARDCTKVSATIRAEGLPGGGGVELKAGEFT
jgi:hypothetical protein